ncbi:SDR family NAD(P)-dependent oxidoreductase [Halomonas sp. CS7]|uniref:SDR family NAD(P)-dependent oxidoreductase n=1 Tax=Halomonas pelophila TaxID=3151122 RepID=A0ABV1N5R9_9GAMM
MLREQLETNLLGTHELTTRVLPMMRAQGHGRIVHISSVLGFAALPYRGGPMCVPSSPWRASPTPSARSFPAAASTSA